MEEIIIQTKNANLTDDQFFQLCAENKMIRFERDKHRNIIIMAPTGSMGGNRNMRIAVKLGMWNEQNKLGYCFDSNSGFTLPDHSVFAPDASWIVKERWEAITDEEKEKFAPICPDFVIEIRSKSDSINLLKSKMDDWMSNGCRLAWMIDPFARTTVVYRPNAEPVLHPFTDILSGGNVLPGFELRLEDLLIK